MSLGARGPENLKLSKSNTWSRQKFQKMAFIFVHKKITWKVVFFYDIFINLDQGQGLPIMICMPDNFHMIWPEFWTCTAHPWSWPGWSFGSDCGPWLQEQISPTFPGSWKLIHFWIEYNYKLDGVVQLVAHPSFQTRLVTDDNTWSWRTWEGTWVLSCCSNTPHCPCVGTLHDRCIQVSTNWPIWAVTCQVFQILHVLLILPQNSLSHLLHCWTPWNRQMYR